jgi:hypothetical protein
MERSGSSSEIQEQKLNKYDVTQRSKAKYSICRRLDNKLNIYIYNVACKHQSQEGLTQNFCVNQFGVLPFCYPC